eukprot:Sdes_comp23522_c0_seq1m21741
MSRENRGKFSGLSVNKNVPKFIQDMKNQVYGLPDHAQSTRNAITEQLESLDGPSREDELPVIVELTAAEYAVSSKSSPSVKKKGSTFSSSQIQKKSKTESSQDSPEKIIFQKTKTIHHDKTTPGKNDTSEKKKPKKSKTKTSLLSFHQDELN